ncbi:MAG TPA: recombinase family protein [Methylocystis sp.]|jgi:DNA invertase Pin-like site-specific DNA recombinase
MTAHLKVQSHHLERGAYLYIRQSSMRQVVENAESAKRQYALRGRAIALGWRDEQIIVIDNDQGESGASASWREGFQRLVSDVGLGRAGIVMGLEVSRLARNNADWQRLLEICALADTLILDEDGVYDPASFNDRLLLGLKGTMSEAELHVIKARLRGGILNKARRGEFRSPLPTGLVYDQSGAVQLDPDMQVRETIIHFFETFSRVGSASQTVKAFRKEGILFPSRLHNSELVFRPLTPSTAIRVLHNPRYAGVYSYGRRQYRRAIDGKKKVRDRDADNWLACIPDAHPGYISWPRHQENLKLLKANDQGFDAARTSIPREGPALLQGRAICGKCGRHLQVRYASRRGRQEAWYVCDRIHNYGGAAFCQTIAGPAIDKAIGLLIAEQITPSAVELTLEVRKEIEARHEEADRLRRRAVERAQIEADLAQRRFMLVDPNNRLVADALEGEWNDKLRILANAREERERAQQNDRLILDKTVRERLIAMTANFTTLWTDPDTPNRERKRLLAYIIEDVTLARLPKRGTTNVHVRFKGGKTQTLVTVSPRSCAEQVKTNPAIIELVDKLLDSHIFSEIADILNDQGFRPGSVARRDQRGARFTTKRVTYLARQYKLKSRYDRLRERGLLTKREAAARLNIHEHTLARWAELGLVASHAYNGHHSLYDLPDADLPQKHSSRWNTLVDRLAAREQAAAGTKTLTCDQKEDAV